MTAGRHPSAGRLLAMTGAILVMAMAARSRVEAPSELLRRSQEFSRHLLTGTLDSLPAGAVLDLGGPGDAVLMRWFRDRRRDSLGKEWPRRPLATLEGREGGNAFRARLEATYGRAVETVDEGVYPCYFPICGRPHSFEYSRISRFSGLADNTLTLGWLWVEDSLVGGWVIPSRRATPSAFATYEPKTTRRLPFDGEWVVLWGGPKPHENYHVEIPPLRFAYDFVVDSGGSLHRTDGRSNADYYCFGLPILAPAAGRVALSLDSFPENVPGTARPGYRGPGNFVTIDHGAGEFSVLAHLRRGSVRVSPGQVVQAGDTLGQCGNNGQSEVPHLHIQSQLSPRPGERPVPALFADYSADGVPIARGTPTRGQRVVRSTRTVPPGR